MSFIFSGLFFFLFLFMFILSMQMLDYSAFSVEFSSSYSFLTEMPIVFNFDFISLVFFSSVCLISSVVFMYSKFYMEEDFFSKNYVNLRFFFLLFLFVLSMFFLIFSGSWIVVMLGWDGLGLVSFILVIFYNNSSSLISGLLTVFMNRVGDCFFILSFMYFFFNGWLSLDFLSFYSSFFFCLIMFLGMITKSAQMPFSSWLPAAMAAPTPVSSLVHSSTLVTAGVYLMIRFNYLLEDIYGIMSILSLLTMFVAGACALIELDFKKVVAMSTLSQLGFMVFSISIGFYLLSFFHMVFHAYFKSTLFLTTGNLMHYFYGGQDSRIFGSMGMSYFSKLFFSLSCLSLVGFPFSLGFYSKDLLLALSVYSFSSVFVFIFILSCLFTIGYSIRLIKMSFLSFPSFFTSISFLDSLLFFSPVILLHLFCVFMGNFFFFYYFPVTACSFIESSMGLVLLILGGYTVNMYYFNYFFLFSLAEMNFLSILSMSVTSLKMKLFSFMLDYTWSELLGGQGFKKIIYLSGLNFKSFFKVDFVSLVFLGFVFIIILFI